MHPSACCVTAWHQIGVQVLNPRAVFWRDWERNRGNKYLTEIYRANANCCCWNGAGGVLVGRAGVSWWLWQWQGAELCPGLSWWLWHWPWLSCVLCPISWSTASACRNPGFTWCLLKPSWNTEPGVSLVQGGRSVDKLEWAHKRGHQGDWDMNHEKRLGENWVCFLLAVTWGDGAGLCSEVYSGRMRGWPKRRMIPLGRRKKIKKKIIGRNFPERVWNALLVGLKDLLVLTQLLEFPSDLNNFLWKSLEIVMNSCWVNFCLISEWSNVA